MVRSLEANWTRREPNVYVFPSITPPTSSGAMPLTSAALWIASRGGRIGITDRHESEWMAAFDELLNALVGGGAELLARDPQTGLDVAFAASNLQGKARLYTSSIFVPFDVPSNDDLNELAEADKVRWQEAERRRQFWEDQARLVPGEVDFIKCVFSPDLQLWNDSENDQFYQAGRSSAVCTHLRVKCASVRTKWPFKPKTTGRANIDCKCWLEEMMRRSPNRRGAGTQKQLFKEAKDKWPGLTRKAFQRAWSDAIGLTGSEWGAPGRRPSKSLRD
jgi:hypothetical protein